MTPSNASTISASRSTASGRSSFAISGSRCPASVMISRACLASSGERTNDSATQSTGSDNANRRSSMSLSDSAGTDNATPGMDRPLWSLTGPPSTTWQRTSGPSTASTSSARLPSSTSSRFPGTTSEGSSAYVVDTRAGVPTTSSTVIATWSPGCQTTARPGANRPSRIFGPCRSASTPTARPVRSAASRTRW
jgi:hypothetical protein